MFCLFAKSFERNLKITDGWSGERLMSCRCGSSKRLRLALRDGRQS